VRRLALIAAVALAGCGGNSDPPGITVRAIEPGGERRAVHTATALPGGRVLIAGGCVTDGCGTATAGTEVFAPGQGFRAGPRMTTPRDGHTATLLGGDRVLLTGGYAGEGMGALRSAEVCDPERCVRAGDLAGPLGAHAATRLRDGTVLVTGGFDEGRALRRVERFARGRFARAAPMRAAREAHTATLLKDGRVLVAGGSDTAGTAVATAELYDPRTDRWTPAGRMAEARNKHAGVALPDGRVLLVGGARDRESRTRLASTEVYDPSTNRFTAGPRLRAGRYKLPGDEVLVLGGYDGAIDIQPGAYLIG